MVFHLVDAVGQEFRGPMAEGFGSWRLREKSELLDRLEVENGKPVNAGYSIFATSDQFGH
jgi:hypothetical protein